MPPRPLPLLATGLTLLVIGFGSGRAESSRPPAAQQPPQQLPLEAEWCLGSGDCILLEVADQPREQAMGLQLRGRLKPLRGMWFPYDEAQLLRFWMHRTPEPLDMLFLREGRVIAIEAGAEPCPHLPCRSYGPHEQGDGVVELAAGEAERLGITVGSPAPIRAIDPKH
jgi:uncharacterized membrane protein (UPF0127 family)